MEGSVLSYYKGLSLEGKHALVFGGTSGLGKSIALGLAQAGADVVPVGRRAEEAKRTAWEIKATGKATIEITGDITDRSQIQAVIDRMLQQMGRIDILVNSAGMTKRVPSLEVEDSLWNQIIEINLKGVWNTCQMVGRVMKEQNYGRIINIASIASFVSAHEVAPYAASKGGVMQITRCLAAEWAKYNITVNAISPGVFETDLNRNIINQPDRRASIFSHTPMKRFGQVEEIKGAAIFYLLTVPALSPARRSPSTAAFWHKVSEVRSDLDAGKDHPDQYCHSVPNRTSLPCNGPRICAVL